MSESLPKIAAFIFFIWLGWFLRRREILKESAFHAVSGLVLYVTIPCIIITNLNGIKIEGLEKPKNDISEGEEEEEY